jgi:predicted ArsR family transcriptional regulator
MVTTALHRALSDERRVQIVEELRGAADGLDVQELARRVGLHANTVRWHLGVLADAGMVSSRTVARAGPGRPRVVYTIATEPPGEGAIEDHRLLSAILTGMASQLADGPARAEEAGRAWGRYLVNRPQPHVHLSDDDATAEVVALLDQQGFRPESADGEILMRRCPFHELAEAHPGIVCSIHRGMISGALAELGSELRVERLDAFVEPNLCVARLTRTERDSEEPSS